MIYINPDTAGLSGKRVLIVEDEPLLAFDYQDELESHGAAGVVAFTLEEGLDAAAAQSFQFAVLDVNLGTEMIWPVARLLTDRAVPYVFVTGRAAAVAEVADVSPVACIDKPIGGRALIGRIADFIGAGPIVSVVPSQG